MRIHRITVRNFRGVEDRAVEFAPNGVTVVEGENEVGKSSVIEALFLLLEVADSSQAERVKSVRPVHTGRNPEVSAEISAGDYQFVYAKCYAATAGARRTTLTISKPVPAQLTGTEAHERVTRILGESVDETLWKALWWQQGVKLDQEQLHSSSSLGAALDAAAGGVRGGAREDNLFARAAQTYEEFYTAKTGKERDIITGPVSAASRATESHASLVEQMRVLEKDSERCESLAGEFASQAPREKHQRAQVNELEASWKEIESEQQRAKQLRLKLELADQSFLVAQEARKVRGDMEATVERAEAAVAGLEEERRRAEPAAEALTASLVEAAGRLKVARETLATSQTAQTVRANDEIHLHDQLDLEQFRERLDQVREAQSVALEAETFLDSTLIDEEAVAEIEAAHIEAAQATARLESGSPSIRVAALASFVLGIDGEPRQVLVGEQFDLTALQPLMLRVGDVAEVTVAGGKNATDFQEQLDAASQRLHQLCAAVGAKDHSDAQSLLRRRQHEEAQLVNAKKTLEQSLRDLTPESLAAKLARTQTKVAEYPAERRTDLPLPTDLNEAKRMHEKATLELGDAKARVEDASSAHSKIQESSDAREKQALTLAVQLQGAADILSEALRDLASARANQTDETLESEVSARQDGAAIGARVYEEAEAKLRAADPETAAALLQNAHSVLARLQADIRRLELELVSLRGTLQLRGEEGLADRRDSARAESVRLHRQADSIRLRADAAKFLFDTLSRRRDESRKAYIKPFKEKIESLGRIVFGDSFSVELRENLQVERRTLNGVTLDFEKLSTGAREQIGVLARLACASIVSAQGGVPFILDDALGWSDAGRLQRLGAAFTASARDCQVIVLTCQPDRYRHIGSATVVRLT